MFKVFDTSDFHLFGVPQHSVSKTEKKLAGFKNLSKGWNYGCGRPIRDNVYRDAEILLRYINELGISKTDAFPGIDGDVCITAYRLVHYLEVTIEIDSTISVSHEINDNEVLSKEGLSLLEARRVLQGVAEEIWGSSDSSIHVTMIESSTGLTTWLLRTPRIAQGFLSSAVSVLIIPEEEFASTFENSIQEYLGSHRYSGNLTRQFYRADTA